MPNNPADRAIACPVCGNMYFPRSMVMHVKACVKKNIGFMLANGMSKETTIQWAESVSDGIKSCGNKNLDSRDRYRDSRDGAHSRSRSPSAGGPREYLKKQGGKMAAEAKSPIVKNRSTSPGSRRSRSISPSRRDFSKKGSYSSSSYSNSKTSSGIASRKKSSHQPSSNSVGRSSAPRTSSSTMAIANSAGNGRERKVGGSNLPPYDIVHRDMSNYGSYCANGKVGVRTKHLMATNASSEGNTLVTCMEQTVDRKFK